MEDSYIDSMSWMHQRTNWKCLVFFVPWKHVFNHLWYLTGEEEGEGEGAGVRVGTAHYSSFFFIFKALLCPHLLALSVIILHQLGFVDLLLCNSTNLYHPLAGEAVQDCMDKTGGITMRHNSCTAARYQTSLSVIKGLAAELVVRSDWHCWANPILGLFANLIGS